MNQFHFRVSLFAILSLFGIFSCDSSSSNSVDKENTVVQQLAGSYIVRTPLQDESGKATGKFFEEMGWLDLTLYDTGSDPKVTAHLQAVGHTEIEINGSYIEDSETKHRFLLFTNDSLHFQIDISEFETSQAGIVFYSGTIDRVTATQRTNFAGGFFLTTWNGKSENIAHFSGSFSPINNPDSLSGKWILCGVENKLIGTANSHETLFNMFLPLTGTWEEDKLMGTIQDGTFEADLSDNEIHGFSFDSDGEKLKSLTGQQSSQE